MSKAVQLSGEGREFLSDALMYSLLSVIAESVGATPEEYLERFERAISEREEDVFSALGAK